jgi:hypothetical protein
VLTRSYFACREQCSQRHPHNELAPSAMTPATTPTHRDQNTKGGDVALIAVRCRNVAARKRSAIQLHTLTGGSGFARPVVCSQNLISTIVACLESVQSVPGHGKQTNRERHYFTKQLVGRLHNPSQSRSRAKLCSLR